LYKNFKAVDLLVGGMAEKGIPNAMLGPTFACIVADQFARSKRSDRYTYDVADEPHSFIKGSKNIIICIIN